MGHRAALKLHTVLPFEAMPCRVEAVLDRGSNAIVYRGRCVPPDSSVPHRDVLIRELFPSHPQGAVFRDEAGAIQIPPQADSFWHTHKECFLASLEIHRRRLLDHPELSGYPLHIFEYNNTLYTVMPVFRECFLSEAVNAPAQPLLTHTRRILGLLDALEAYHKCGYLHLNIEPGQILLWDADGQEQVFLMHNSLWGSDAPVKPGFASPEAESCAPETADFSSDLYSVTAVFFYCLTGRALTLEELLRSGGPSLRDCPCLSGEAYPVRQMVSRIFRQGLHVLPSRRYRSISQMRKAFLELQTRILNAGVTHWSLWEYGRRAAEEWAGSLTAPSRRDPLLEEWIRQGKRHSPSVPALIRIGEASGSRSVLRQILACLRLEQDPRAMEALIHLLQSPEDGTPVLLLVLTGMQSLSPAELSELCRFPGLRLLDDTGALLPLPAGICS